MLTYLRHIVAPEPGYCGQRAWNADSVGSIIGAMATDGVQQYLYLLDEAFDGATGWHSLLGNLRTVTPESWEWVPPGGERTVRDIVQHVGSCKYKYENHAFGDASLGWDHELVDGKGVLADTGSAVEWLREGQERLRGSIAALDDGGLLVPRLTNWGEWKDTRWIIAVMIGHDLYHAGEINHIRSLHQQSDHWAYSEGA